MSPWGGGERWEAEVGDENGGRSWWVTERGDVPSLYKYALLLNDMIEQTTLFPAEKSAFLSLTHRPALLRGQSVFGAGVWC